MIGFSAASGIMRPDRLIVNARSKIIFTTAAPLPIRRPSPRKAPENIF
jgi:hypothetical protein